jgi:cell division septum initiation protein DivIVA
MDPIQQVLEAQAEAERSVEAARAEAARALDTVRAEATRLQARNADRTLRAVRHYEDDCAARLQKEIEALHADARDVRERFMLAAETGLDNVINTALNKIWPAY